MLGLKLNRVSKRGHRAEQCMGVITDIPEKRVQFIHIQNLYSMPRQNADKPSTEIYQLHIDPFL